MNHEDGFVEWRPQNERGNGAEKEENFHLYYEIQNSNPLESPPMNSFNFMLPEKQEENALC
jgi:hypothetical protein